MPQLTLLGFIDVDTSARDAKLKATKKAGDQLDKEQKNRGAVVRQWWSYVNQLGTMMLSQLSKAVEGTQLQTLAMKGIAVAQVAQSEIAVIQAFQQSALAAASHHPGQAAILFSIATGLQVTAAQATVNRIQAFQNDRFARNIARQIKSYRS